MRRSSHSGFARLIAVILVTLAASPLTAPFTTCDLADFTHHRPANVPHPGHDVAVPGVKVAPSVDTVASQAPAALGAAWIEIRYEPPLVTAAPQSRRALQAVLRI